MPSISLRSGSSGVVKSRGGTRDRSGARCSCRPPAGSSCRARPSPAGPCWPRRTTRSRCRRPPRRCRRCAICGTASANVRLMKSHLDVLLLELAHRVGEQDRRHELELERGRHVDGRHLGQRLRRREAEIAAGHVTSDSSSAGSVAPFSQPATRRPPPSAVVARSPRPPPAVVVVARRGVVTVVVVTAAAGEQSLRPTTTAATTAIAFSASR